VRDFIVQHEPHVIVVGASGLDAWQLKADMEAVRNNLIDTDPDFMTRLETGGIDIRCGRLPHKPRTLLTTAEPLRFIPYAP
jgi:hypothetical protein